jgi:CRP-like cAMP-binding protein
MFFIVLDGECEAFGTIKEDVDKAIEREKESLDAMNPSERRKRIRQLDLLNVRKYSIMKAGDGFGDIAFRQNSARTACIRAKTALEVLMVQFQLKFYYTM